MSYEQTSDKQDYEVGYRKPPKSGQFKKGESGNPAGRKPGPRKVNSGFGKLFSEGMQRPIEIEESGKKIVLTRMHLAIRKRVEEAAKGKMRAVKDLVKLLETKDEGPLAPATRLVLALDEALALGPLGYALYRRDVEIIRRPKPSVAGEPVKPKLGAAQSAHHVVLPASSLRSSWSVKFR